MTEAGAIYVGDVVHKRLRPKMHKLRYRVFSMLVDLDRLDELDRGLKLFSVNRFNVFSLFETDFGRHDGTALAAFIRARATKMGLNDVARIRLLAYPRILGYAFNPLAVFFLEDADGKLLGVIYEVHNTFGEHHFYDTPTEPDLAQQTHLIPKGFYVSPFNTLDGNYRFTLRPPTEKVFTGIVLETDDGPLLSAYFDGAQRPLSDAQLFKLLLAYPLMTAKVLLGIHWEALLLWLKGVPLTLRWRRGLGDAGAARH